MGLARSLAWDKGKPKNPHATPAYGAPDKLRTSVGVKRPASPPASGHAEGGPYRSMQLGCGGLSEAAKGRRLRVSAIDDLVDGVDRFPFTGTAAENEDAGDEVEVIIVSVLAVIFAVLMQNDLGDTNGLTTVPAMHTAEVLQR
jgi:hypothetical protein